MNLKCQLSFLVIHCCTLFEDSAQFGFIFRKMPYLRYPEILYLNKTIETNENYTIYCRGDGYYKWIMPQVEKYRWTTFRIEPYILNESYRGSELHIINMTYPFIGLYYCYDTYLPKIPMHPPTYLFVNDPDHLTIIPENISLSIYVTQYDEAVIGCKPTSPDVNVTLFDLATNTEIPINVRLPNEHFYRYDSRFGFITNSTNVLLDPLIFKCDFHKKGRKQTRFAQIIVEEPVNHLPTPNLREISEGDRIAGTDLLLECSINSTNYVIFHWTSPNHEHERLLDATSHGFMKNRRYLQRLLIHRATESDSGTYSCFVTDNQWNISNASLINIEVYAINKSVSAIEKHNVSYQTLAYEGEPSVKLEIIFNAHPNSTVTWLNNKYKTIRMENGSKYEVFHHYNKTFLNIKNIEIEDSGNYTLFVFSSRMEKFIYFLNVTGTPKVMLNVKSFYLINSSNTVDCFTYSHSKPEFLWFKSCDSINCDYMPINGSHIKHENYKYQSQVTINTTESGYLRCSVRNSKGNSTIMKKFYVSDVENGFNIYSLDKNVYVDKINKLVTLIEGETSTIICSASLPYYNIRWLYDHKDLTSIDGYKITNSSTKYSSRLELEIQHVNTTNAGYYICKVTDENAETQYLTMTFLVIKPEEPQLINSTLQDIKYVKELEDLVLYCKFSGIPKPTLTWYKNGDAFQTLKDRMHISENNETIVVHRTIKQDEGNYKCEATNKINSFAKEQNVTVISQSSIYTEPLIAISTITVVCSIGVIVFITVKQKLLQRELKSLGLTNFQKGAIKNINRQLGIGDQVELLPYHKKWEIPRENIKLGKQLGSGAFGVVMEGVAKNVVKGEYETTVAVKMVKQNVDHTYIRALASELKILAHLGKHLNIVNLIGACTRNVVKKELLVVVEYCRFGNLHNYLLKHRGNFINQINPETVTIDYGIDQISLTYSRSGDKSNSSQTVEPAPNNEACENENLDISVSSVVQDSTVSENENGMTLDDSDNIQPAHNSDCKKDSENITQPICTKDLLSWAFQVARGMEYLSSRKILHGDLAARNILLADNGVVKICDFGLAKNMYTYENYTKKGDSPLPLKWMAIESIKDRIFSTQSDVWSFGIVMWEFFSLAETPYPGIEANERLYQKLSERYRMSSPQFAPKEIYTIMTECWSQQPLDRPSFNMLSVRLGCLLEDPVRQHYVDLNDPYLRINIEQFKDDATDYLSLFNPPTFEVLSTSDQVPETERQGTLDNDYQNITPATSCSQVTPRDAMKNSNETNSKHLNLEEKYAMKFLQKLQKTNYINPELYKSKEFE